MTVAELIALLEEFPPDLPAFFSPDADGRIAVAPRDAVMNLVHPARGEVMPDEQEDSHGFVDSVVIYPQPVRDVC